MCYPKKNGIFRKKKSIVDKSPPKPLSFVGEPHKFSILKVENLKVVVLVEMLQKKIENSNLV